MIKEQVIKQTLQSQTYVHQILVHPLPYSAYHKASRQRLSQISNNG